MSSDNESPAVVELPDDAIKALVEAASGIDIMPELLARVPEAVEYVDAWRKTLIDNGSLREESPTNEFLGVVTIAATWAVNGVIAARVRAEAVAEHRAEQRHWIDVGQQIEAEKRVAEAERDEYRRNWQEAEKRATEALAAERRRLQRVHAIMEAAIVRGGYRGDEERQVEVLRAAGSVPVATPQRPEIVVLCGSTRFKDAFRGAAKAEALAGRIVLTVSDLDPRPEARHVNVPIDAETKALLDDLHKRKIDLAERVLVLNVGGYIGESTRSEIEYATALGKPINYLETDPCRCPDCAASPVLVGHPEPWFRETPESLALLEAERAEVAAVEARAGRPPGDRETFDRRAGEEEAQAELLGHRPAVGETAEQPEER